MKTSSALYPTREQLEQIPELDTTTGFKNERTAHLKYILDVGKVFYVIEKDFLERRSGGHNLNFWGYLESIYNHGDGEYTFINIDEMEEHNKQKLRQYRLDETFSPCQLKDVIHFCNVNYDKQQEVAIKEL